MYRQDIACQTLLKLIDESDDIFLETVYLAVLKHWNLHWNQQLDNKPGNKWRQSWDSSSWCTL